jgi:hypothetical protein
VTVAQIATAEAPAVTDLESGDDRAWFATHPGRRYRVSASGTGWRLVRRRSGVLLRVWTKALPRGLPNTDKALCAAWIDAAWPGLSPLQRAELMRQAGREERAGA